MDTVNHTANPVFAQIVTVDLESARTRTQRRARAERTRAHAKARADRRGHGLKSAAAARADFEAGVGAGKMSAEPMPASGTLRVDTLHGPTGQILHARVLQRPLSR